MQNGWYRLAIIKKVNSEAPWLLTKCKGRFVSYIFYKQHLIVIYLYIVENYVASWL